MDIMEVENVDFNKLYKLHTGHRVFNESDDSSTSSESESDELFDANKPPIYTYEELKANLVTYEPGNKSEGATTIKPEVKPNKDSHNAVKKTSVAAVAPQTISIKAKHSVDTKSVQNLKIPDAVLAGPVSETQNIIPSTETLYPLKGSYCDVLKLPQSMAKKAQDQKASIEPSKANTPTFCSLCNVNASSQQNMTQHVKGAKHKKMLQQQSSANVPERIVTPVIDNKDCLKSLEERVLEQRKKLTLPDYCYICAADLAQPPNAKSHYKSLRHKMNAGIWKKKEISKITKATRDLENHKNRESTPSGSSTFCSVCNIRTPSEEHMIQHLNGAKHASKLQEQSLYVPRRIITPVANNKDKNTNMPVVTQQSFPSKSEQSLERNSVANKVLDSVTAGPINEIQNALPITTTLDPRKAPHCEVLKLPPSETKEADDQKTSIELFKPVQCFLCNLNFYAQKQLSDHQSTFPHCDLIGMKNDLISQGIISEYWTLSKCRKVIRCLLCDATLQGSSSARAHLQSRRHIDDLDVWVSYVAAFGKTNSSSWYYCDTCNIKLDGTSNAEIHYQSNIHLSNNTNNIVEADESPQIPETNQTDSCEVMTAETNAQNSADCLLRALDISVVENNQLNDLDLDKSHDSAESSQVNSGSTLDIAGNEEHSQLALNIEKPEVTSSTSLPDDSRNNMPDLLANNMQMISDASVTGCLVHIALDCYVCRIKFKSRDELANHCKESPHKYIFKMKSYIVAKGILNEYWSIVNSDVKCTLCDLTLTNDSAIKSHFASKKHISRFNQWLQLETKDILAPSRKWFYCDLCSLELDGTTNADDHYGEEGHVRMQEILGANIEQSLEHDIEFSELESKPEVTSHREPDFPYSSSADIDNEENLHLKAEVLSEIKELVNLVYFTKCIPPKIAFKYFQKCNRELKRQNLTEHYFNTVLRNQHDFKISNSASTNLRFKGSNDENNDCSSILTHEAHTILEEKSSAIFHTVPEIPETRESNGRFIFEIFAYGAAGIILLYLMKRS